MDKIVEWINNNALLAALVTLISIIGFILTIITLIVQRKRKSIAYVFNTLTLIENQIAKIPGLSIHFDNKPIECIVVTKLRVWNNGNVLLTKDDVYQNHPICIELKHKNCSILSVDIIRESSDTCNFILHTDEDKQTIRLSFDYLEKTQGIILNIYHTNTSSDPFKINGKIKEGKLINLTQIQEVVVTIGVADPIINKFLSLIIKLISKQYW